MFHPTVIAAKEAGLAKRPQGGLVRYPHAVCREMVEHLADAQSPKGELLRPLSAEETAFVKNERLLCAIDFRYWAERYAIVVKESQDAEPLFPLWESQDLFLARVADLELSRQTTHHPDGILVNVLKARQLGMSTLAEMILAHRVTTQTSVRGLVASDAQEQSRYMFSMLELAVDRLPWWLRPMRLVQQTGDLLQFDTDSAIRTGWGHSSRGGLQKDRKVKGNIGRGRTHGILHLSELSTWERPEQIDDSLMPGVPRRSRTCCIFESTAKGRHDWWHHHWLRAERGDGRFTNIFIPWYIVKDKYWLPLPPSWEPADTTKQHAEEVERTSPQYLMGKTYRLRPEQMYWYEVERRAWESEDSMDFNLHKFMEEFPATADSAFQHAGRSIFPASTLERVKTYERVPEGIFYVRPARDIASLKAWERAQMGTSD